MANTLKFGNGNWATKKGSTLAYNDLNSNYKPLPFNFSRASKATVINKDGLIEEVGSGEPRIDYLNNTKGALKLEPQRTNLITYSEQLDNGSGWINQLGSTVIGNQIGVGNSTTAWKLNKASGTFKSLRFQSSLSSANYTLSWYLKKGNLDVAEFRFDGGLGAQFIDFNLSTGVAGTNNSLTNIKMELINNDWYRCQASCNSTITNVHLYIGNGSSTTQEGYIYAQSPQLEVGSYATSYIPTSGSAVTRVVDKCISAGNNQVIKSTEGTIYAEQKSLETNFTYNYFVAVSDGTNNNRLEIRQTATGLQFLWRVGGTYQSQIVLTNAPFTSFIKFALRYSSANIKFYVNGSLVGTLNSPTLYASGVLNNIEFADGSGGTNFRGTVKDLKYYNTALSDAELASLTQV